MATDLERLYNLLHIGLETSAPVMSGSMRGHITSVQLNGSEVQITIDAPYYDLNKWNKEKVVVYTGQSFNGKTAYADDVNKYGGFNTHNSSEGWVNRSVIDVVNAIANEIGAEVINEL